MKIYLTRHPVTKEIENKIIQGKNYGSVSKKGFIQIEHLIPKIKSKKIDKIISSDAKRCIQMTKKILEEIDIPFEFTGLIDEKSYGDLAGKKIDSINKNDISGNSFEDEKYSTGESLNDLKKRVDIFIEYFLKNYAKNNENVLIISHSIFLSIFIGQILNKELLESRKEFIMDNCALTTIDFNIESKKFKLEFFNENSHLKN